MRLTNFGKFSITVLIILGVFIAYNVWANPEFLPMITGQRQKAVNISPDAKNTKPIAERVTSTINYYSRLGWYLDKDIAVFSQGNTSHVLIFVRR